MFYIKHGDDIYIQTNITVWYLHRGPPPKKKKKKLHDGYRALRHRHRHILFDVSLYSY